MYFNEKIFQYFNINFVIEIINNNNNKLIIAAGYIIFNIIMVMTSIESILIEKCFSKKNSNVLIPVSWSKVFFILLAIFWPIVEKYLFKLLGTAWGSFCASIKSPLYSKLFIFWLSIIC